MVVFCTVAGIYTILDTFLGLCPTPPALPPAMPVQIIYVSVAKPHYL